MSMQYFVALEVARERTREAEAHARRGWGVEPEPSFGQRAAARLARFAGILRRGTSSRDAQDWHPEAAGAQQSRDLAVV